MPLIRIETRPSRRQLVVFGAAWLVVFGAVGAAFWLGGWRGSAAALWIVAAAVPAAGAAVGGLMRLVYLAAAYVTLPVGFVLSLAVLAGVYYLVLTPIGLVMRLCGRDPMARRFDPQAESYWTPRQPPKGPGRYLQQF